MRGSRALSLFVLLCVVWGSLPAVAQDLSPFRVGLLFYKQDQPIDAAEP